MMFRTALCLTLACSAIWSVRAQDDGTRPKLIPIQGEVAPKPNMNPVPDEDAPTKPKLIRVPQKKPKPAAAAEPTAQPAPSDVPAVEDMPAAPNPAVRRPRGQTQTEQPTAPAAVTAPVSDPPSSEENYEYCNRTSFAINVAVGILDNVSEKVLWRVRGWWTIFPGECKPIVRGKLIGTAAYFTFAKSHFIHQGAMRTWGGSHMLCVGRGQFQSSSDGTGNCAPGLEPQGFARIDLKGRTSWKTTLVESDALKSNEQAKVAGLQRLLTDLSIYAGPPDGNAGPAFRQSLIDARTKFGYPADEDPSQTYQKLMAEAAKLQSQTGLTFCNRSASAIWVALGLDEEGRKQSRGWWRIQTGQCEKVIKDRLAQRYLFAHASNDKGGADGAWAGKYPFCTKDAVFEMEGGDNCESRGGERTGFFAIDTQGRPGAVYNFNPKSAAASGAQ